MNLLEDISIPCPLCNRRTDVGEPVHRICMLRDGIGGIGHLLDHRLWCLIVEDPDAELSRLDSARCVEALIARYGVEAVMDGSFPPTTLSEVCGWAGVAL